MSKFLLKYRIVLRAKGAKTSMKCVIICQPKFNVMSSGKGEVIHLHESNFGETDSWMKMNRLLDILELN